MLSPERRPPIAWIVVAHVIGGLVIGGLDAARVGSTTLALAVVPVFAATGLLVGAVIAGAERLVTVRALAERGWLAALVLAVPSAIVTVPVAGSLFDGAYAQTLPLARQAPVLLPIVLWLVAAAAIGLGRWMLRSGDLIARSIAVLALAGVVGTIVWAERHVLRTGYATAHAGATVALVVLVGIAVRVARRATVPAPVAAPIVAIVVGTALAAALYGLRAPADRQLLATYGDQTRDLVRVWRSIIDLDRDGSSRVLGGGDCDDFDAARHPGALDVPGDGIDQDCDGQDAVAPPAAPPPAPHAATNGRDVRDWRAESQIAPVLERASKMNVVLLSVDALRFDLLAPGAPHRDDFPNLVKLLDESVWFTHAVAPASGTDVSLSTVLTGRFDPFQPVATTLVEALHGQGRRTYAAIPGEVTRYVGDTLIGRGVDKLAHVHTDWDVQDIGDHVSADATTLEGLRALEDAAGAPTFLWLHYFDVHEHHQIDVPKPLLDAVHPGGSPVIHKYRALLHAIDNEIGRFLAALDAHHLADSTIVVFVSDHGEALADDPRLLDTHGQVAYGPLVRVPLAIHIPGVAPAQRTDLVSLVDLAPTLLDLVGAPAAMQPLDGVDLVPALFDAPAGRPAGRAIAIHEELQWSVVEWPYQLLVRPADDVVELYDLDHDPAEHTDLAATHAEIVSRLRARYAEFPQVHVDRTPSGRTFREQQAQPPQSRARERGGAARARP